MTKQLATAVSEDTWKRVLKVTDEEEVSVASWIRDAIEKYLDYKNNLRKE